MPIVAVAWIYVVLMAALVEWLSPGGSGLGAFFTLVGWGVLPLVIVLYVLGTPARRRARRAREAATSAQPDRGGHASGDAVAPEREEA
ncbi:MAG TPA: hypothetical protein VFQ16_02420 [Burkholderiaceae bacterium]|nr:hypothetical protein [Burkholderiaceae bacterium]